MIGVRVENKSQKIALGILLKAFEAYIQSVPPEFDSLPVGLVVSNCQDTVVLHISEDRKFGEVMRRNLKAGQVEFIGVKGG